LSSIACTSSGSDRLSMKKLVQLRPHWVKAGSTAALSFSDSALWLAARSRNAISPVPSAEAIEVAIAARSCGSTSLTVSRSSEPIIFTAKAETSSIRKL